MEPKCPMCGGKKFDRVRNIVRGGPVRYSFLGDIAGRLTPTTLISSLPVKARACLGCGYVAMMVDDLEKLQKLAARDATAFELTEEAIGENLEALEQMEADRPQVESSDVLEDLDLTAEEENRRRVEALETLANVPAPEADDEAGPLKDLTEAVEPDNDREGPS